MRTSLFHLLAAIAVLPLSASVAQTAATDPYRNEPAVFERLDSHITMHADGTGETVTRVVLRVQSEGTARQFAVLSVSYASANETGSIDFVRVRKPDGTVVETPVTEAIEMPAEITRSAPVYSDIREKHLPVRSLAVGDTLDYQFHTVRTRAEAPNQFWGAEHFATTGGVVLSQTLTLAVPASTYVQVWSPNHPAQPTTKDGMKVWQWTSSQTKPSTRDESGKMTPADVKDPDEDSEGRNLPSVAWTTFHSWAEVGDWYRSLAESRIQPNPAVRAKAEDLTKDARTPDEQVRALYRYVATQTRYVGISLGVGRYQPHAAADVMANQYGDCKDKDALLESLLRAKGFSTSPALIGAGIVPVPEVPTPAVFNHVITTVNLPSGTIWLDTTPEVAPFRVLNPILRDQQALVVPESGPATLQKTPADPPFPYKETFIAVGKLDSKGVLKGHMEYTIRSDNEFGFRSMLQRVAPAQWDSSMQYVSSAMGFGGQVSNADLRQADPAGPVKLSYDYTREGFADWQNARIVPLFPALEVTTIDKDKAPEHDIDLGAPRTLSAHSDITLPDGDRADLPEAVHVKRPYATFDKTYRLSDGKLVADRTTVILQHKVPKEQWKDYLAFCKEAGWDEGETFITLIPASAPAGKAKPATTAEAAPAPAVNQAALDLMRDAEAAERRNDWDTARADLQQATQKDPKAPYLMSMRGYVATHDNKLDEAAADYKAELHEHPNANSSVVLLLASVYARQKQYGAAVDLLKQYSDRKELQLEGTLAAVQSLAGDEAGALATWQSVVAQFPDNRQVQGQMAETLRRLHRNDEAVAAAKKAMEGSDDPYLINNEAYLLAETNMDLPLAEEQSRRAIDMLEKRTAAVTIDEANSKAFADSANLVASWDTLAYILLQANRPKEAEPYFRAAWFNKQDMAVGDHLGQTWEALGRKADALRAYKLSVQTEGAADNKEDYAEARRNIERLEKAGVKPTEQPASLQAMRTYHVNRPAGAQGGGTVRVQLGTTGVTASTLVTGDASLKKVLPALQRLPITGAVPAGSSARVLRDAVVYCGKAGAECDFVFLTTSGIEREGTSE